MAAASGTHEVVRLLYAEDKRLVRRLLAGDERAFETFFADHFSMLYRLALTRLGGNVADAEEVAQASLCKAVGKLETYRGEAALATWLATFCRHEIWALQRKRRQAPQVSLVEDTTEIRAALESLASIALDDPEAEARRNEIGRLVQVALDQLPPNYGKVLEWKYLRDQAVKEMAPRLGLSPKATESLLARARLAFRDAFVALIDNHAGAAALKAAPTETP